MKALLLLYKSALPLNEAADIARNRSDTLHGVKGLLQRLFINDESTGQIGGVYLFDNIENLDAFRHSELGKSFMTDYKFDGSMTQRIFNVISEFHSE